MVCDPHMLFETVRIALEMLVKYMGYCFRIEDHILKSSDAMVDELPAAPPLQIADMVSDSNEDCRDKAAFSTTFGFAIDLL